MSISGKKKGGTVAPSTRPEPSVPQLPERNRDPFRRKFPAFVKVLAGAIGGIAAIAAVRSRKPTDADATED